MQKENKFENWKDARLSFSSLKRFAESPDHFIAYKKQVFEPTDAMIVGQMIHALILEPHTVEHSFMIWDGGRRAGKAWDEFKAVANDAKKTIIRDQDFEGAKRVADAVRKHPIAGQMIDGIDQAEQLLLWDDPETGVPLKGFLDMIGESWFADLKSGADTDPDKFIRNAYDQKLPLQFALYSDALKANGYDCDEPFVIRFGTSEPFPVVIYQPTTAFMAYGHAIKKRLLEKWVEWDGFSAGIEFHTGQTIHPLSVPRWAKSEPHMEKIESVISKNHE